MCTAPERGGAPKMCITFLGGFKDKIEVILSTKRVSPANSLDLERGPAPRSIAAEFSGETLLVLELQRCQVTHFSQK